MFSNTSLILNNQPLFVSDHNMSVQKQTLRANNKALAQNLAKMRLEVRRLQKENTDLECRNQETQHELRRLTRVVGIKDVEIEDEVQKRIQVSWGTMIKKLTEIHVDSKSMDSQKKKTGYCLI